MDDLTHTTTHTNYTTLKITQIGNSLGVVLPKEVLANLDVIKGDKIYLSRAPDGYNVTKSDPEFEHQMAVARRVMKESYNVLRELAK